MLMSTILSKHFQKKLANKQFKSIKHYKDIFNVNMLKLVFLGLFLTKSLDNVMFAQYLTICFTCKKCFINLQLTF